jgi:hypothetical protein
MWSHVRYLVLCCTLLVAFIFIYMYYRGARYRNYISHCRDATAFCGITVQPLPLPPAIVNTILTLLDAKTELAKRVNIYNWKAGRTIKCGDLVQYAPNVIEYYFLLGAHISQIIGVPVEPTSLDLPTSCCVLMYDQEGDFINYHYDVNYFSGRFFTVIIPITNQITCTKFVYRDHDGQEIFVDLANRNSVIFEGDLLFHMASKLCAEERRVVLSLQYSTDGTISLFNKFFMAIKDRAYI